jgi:hypothetical protein
LTTSGGRLFTQVGSAAEEQDWFGWALAAGDFNHDGFADLAVGASYETVGSVFAAGAVSVLYGSAAGLSTSGGQLFTHMGGSAQGGGQFGWAPTARSTNPSWLKSPAASAHPTAAAYAGQVEDLAAALILWRRQEHRSGAGPRSRNLLAATCGRRIRVAKTTLAEAPIFCAACEQPFEPADPDDQDL